MDPRKNDVCCEGDDVESLGRVGFCTWGPLVDDFHHGNGEEMRKRRRERGGGERTLLLANGDE